MLYFENGLTLPVDVQALVPQENRDAAIRQHVPPPAICCRQLSEHFDELVSILNSLIRTNTGHYDSLREMP
jgi:hypothetical protein